MNKHLLELEEHFDRKNIIRDKAARTNFFDLDVEADLMGLYDDWALDMRHNAEMSANKTPSLFMYSS